MAGVVDPRLALMGGAPTQGNLRAVRARAQDLQKTIDEVIFGLRFNAGVLKWDDIVRKYSVINTQLAGLREALRPGTLDGFAVLPRLVPDPGFAEAVTVQLASALTPEGEAAAAEAAAAVDSALGLMPEMPSMQRFEVLSIAVEAHNSLISSLMSPAPATGPGGGGSGGVDGPLSPQGPLRRRQREISEATTAVLQSKAQAAAAAATALAAAMSGPPATAATGGGRQQAAHQGPPQRRGPPGAAAAGGGAAGRPGGGSEPMDPALVFLLTGSR